MAISSAKTYLGYRDKNGSGTYSVACFIKDVPALGGEPETIDTSTLANEYLETSMIGLQSASNLTFNYNFSDEVVSGTNPYSTLKGMAETDNEYEWCLLLQNGDTFTWVGKPTTWLDGFGVNEVVPCVLSISKSTEPKYTQGNGTYNKTAHTITVNSI